MTYGMALMKNGVNLLDTRNSVNIMVALYYIDHEERVQGTYSNTEASWAAQPNSAFSFPTDWKNPLYAIPEGESQTSVSRGVRTLRFRRLLSMRHETVSGVAWTVFRFRYVICGLPSTSVKSTGTHGVRIMNEDGSIAFDSTLYMMNILRVDSVPVPHTGTAPAAKYGGQVYMCVDMIGHRMSTYGPGTDLPYEVAYNTVSLVSLNGNGFKAANAIEYYEPKSGNASIDFRQSTASFFQSKDQASSSSNYKRVCILWAEFAL